MIRVSLGLAVAGASLFALVAPVAAEVTESSADHFVTRNTATVKAAPKAAWLTLIEPGSWWDDQHTWSGSATNMSLVPQGGGCFCERIPENDGASEVGLAGSAQHMTVVMAEPMKVLRMRGALGPLQSEPVDGVLTVTMQPVKDGGTKIVWEYVVAGHLRYPAETISKAVDGVMSQQLGHLADKLGRLEAAPAAKPTAAPSDDKPPAKLPEKPKPKAEDGKTTDVGAALDAMDRKKDE